MGAENVLPLKGTKIKIDGKEHIIKFTMEACAKLSDKYGSIIGALEVFRNLDGKNMTARELYTLADIVEAALSWENYQKSKADPEYEIIDSEYIRNNFQMAEIAVVMPQIIDAFIDSMGGKAAAPKAKKENPRKE